ncbi:MAG: PTPA-CTERM sorting domain-containing protein [Synechococcales cyanobacterium RM1_1_8]|nr:PTPA-CTERM sorting domain-containing protein [Synechococcales cyanobacterium RM1_1_8]
MQPFCTLWLASSNDETLGSNSIKTKDITAIAGTAGTAHFTSLIPYSTTTTLPALVLLPGLLGFGATILRKRKQAVAST